MDVKGAFDYVLKSWLFMCIINLGINTNLVIWTKFIFTNRKIQLVIDKHNNKKRDIKIEISQSLPALQICFLIYINRVFEAVIKNNPTVISLLFLDNLKFIVSKNSVQETSKTLEIVASSVFWKGLTNVIIYNISKTKAI